MLDANCSKYRLLYFLWYRVWPALSTAGCRRFDGLELSNRPIMPWSDRLTDSEALVRCPLTEAYGLMSRLPRASFMASSLDVCLSSDGGGRADILRRAELC